MAVVQLVRKVTLICVRLHNHLEIFQDGGYAEYSLVPDYKFLIKISGIDLEGAASLSCSGLTAYTAVKKAISNSPENILIVGAGGLGLMAVQISKST